MIAGERHVLDRLSLAEPDPQLRSLQGELPAQDRRNLKGDTAARILSNRFHSPSPISSKNRRIGSMPVIVPLAVDHEVEHFCFI